MFVFKSYLCNFHVGCSALQNSVCLLLGLFFLKIDLKILRFSAYLFAVLCSLIVHFVKFYIRSKVLIIIFTV